MSRLESMPDVPDIFHPDFVKGIIYRRVNDLTSTEIRNLIGLVHDHNDGNTLGHKILLGYFLFRNGYDAEQEDPDHKTTESEYADAFIHECCKGEEYILYTAWIGDTCVGISGCVVDRTAYKHSFTVVHADYRGRGIARTLMTLKERYVIKNTKVKFLTFVTNDHNTDMHALAELIGYTYSGTCQGRRSLMRIYVKKTRG